MRPVKLRIRRASRCSMTTARIWSSRRTKERPPFPMSPMASRSSAASGSAMLSPRAVSTVSITRRWASPSAPAELLSIGGLGTYVRAVDETDEQVGDHANDACRITAAELRAKVVVEGGNLGFTQRARIEYALAGGRINTDAIDNSAGVDLSDHEVNLKVCLLAAVEDGRLSPEARNALLAEVADEVADRVLA